MASSFCSEYVSSFRNLELLKNDLTTFLPWNQHRELVELMVSALMDYMSPMSDLYALKCICSICHLYTKLLSYVPYRQMEESAYLSKSKKMARLNRITEYIDENYAEKITLEELAAKEQISVTYLSHFIRENLSMTFQEYISSVRFERALKLLRGSSMCLTDVSVVCGFSDVKYLTRMLEKHFGMPAAQCREKLRRENPVPVRSGRCSLRERSAQVHVLRRQKAAPHRRSRFSPERLPINRVLRRRTPDGLRPALRR